MAPDDAPGGRSGVRLAALAVVVGLALVAAAVVALVAIREGTPVDDAATDATAPPTTVASGDEPDDAGPAVPEPSAGLRTYEAACRGELVVEATPGIADEHLVEVSGIAVDDAGTTWVVNDSGDAPRLYGIDGDGAVQVVSVTGAEAVDWEDLALARTTAGPVLWIADTGGNLGERPTVQLYAVAVPAAGATEVEARRVDVTYPDGSHDVEALAALPDGALLLITKDPGRAAAYRVDPSSPSAEAELLGTFVVGNGETTVVTGADVTADGSTVVLRTYGSVFLVPVDPGQPVLEALALTDRRCRGIPPLELQGEAVAFLPGGEGYVTMGEGTEPHRTTVRLAEP